jgi:hypothetical protein
MSEDTSEDRPEPVEGEEFRASARKWLGLVGGGFLLTGIGLLVVGWRLGWWELLAGRRPNLFITIAAGVVALLGPFLVVHSLVMLFRKRKVVIGADRVQLVESRGGSEVVVAQVMYANVAGLVPHKDEGIKQLKVTLEDRDAPGTYDAVTAIHLAEKKAGHNLVIEDRYEGKLEDLTAALEDAIMDWREKNDEDE